MSCGTRWLGGLLILGACGGDKEDTGGLLGSPPDVAGHYNVIVSAATGCGEDGETWIQGWAEGPLNVEGSDGDLTFDFGEDYIFTGSVLSSQTYSFGGDIEYDAAALAVYSTGTFTSESYTNTDGSTAYRWTMAGDFSIEVDDDEFESNNCTVEGPYQATQL